MLLKDKHKSTLDDELFNISLLKIIQAFISKVTQNENRKYRGL